MRKSNRAVRRMSRALALAATGGMVLHSGSCNLNDINVGSSVTVNGRDALISILRGVILTPIDEFITEGINEIVGDDDD